MPALTLTTSRLVLRQIQADDAAALFPVLSDPDVMTWWSSGPHQSLAETADYVASNATEAGRAQNRRVEIIITPTN